MIPVPLLNPTFRTRTRREVRANFGFAAVAIGPVRLARRLAQRREAGLAMPDIAAGRHHALLADDESAARRAELENH